jgi:hypothetical protein
MGTWKSVGSASADGIFRSPNPCSEQKESELRHGRHPTDLRAPKIPAFSPCFFSSRNVRIPPNSTPPTRRSERGIVHVHFHPLRLHTPPSPRPNLAMHQNATKCINCHARIPIPLTQLNTTRVVPSCDQVSPHRHPARAEQTHRPQPTSLPRAKSRRTTPKRPKPPHTSSVQNEPMCHSDTRPRAGAERTQPSRNTSHPHRDRLEHLTAAA